MKNTNIISYIKKRPHAVAKLKGSDSYPNLCGTVEFLGTRQGVLVSVNVSGLPTSDNVCKKPIFAMHIHSGGSCTGNKIDEFADTMTHYNPDNCPHPYHAGDVPPIFGVNGSALSMFLTDRFFLDEIIGKSVIIHSEPDDFTTQPSGNSGTKIACGIIQLV